MWELPWRVVWRTVRQRKRTDRLSWQFLPRWILMLVSRVYPVSRIIQDPRWLRSRTAPRVPPVTNFAASSGLLDVRYFGFLFLLLTDDAGDGDQLVAFIEVDKFDAL